LQKIYRQLLKKITYLPIRPGFLAQGKALGGKTKAKGFRAKASAKNFGLKAKAKAVTSLELLRIKLGLQKLTFWNCCIRIAHNL